ncbi:UNVERIFIED_CONTAM: hypothetical protein FKN15_075181 [Acipenser sinensis]
MQYVSHQALLGGPSSDHQVLLQRESVTAAERRGITAACLVFSLPCVSHATHRSNPVQDSCTHLQMPSPDCTQLPPYTTTRALRSSCTRRLAVPPLRSPASRARSFSTLTPQWWNDLPTDVRTAQSLTIFRHLFKTHLFRQHL